MKKLWGGRFAKKTHPALEAMSRSLHFDARLARYDVEGSLIHIRVLREAGLLTKEEWQRLNSGLEAIQAEIEKGTFRCPADCEDIHAGIQQALLKKAGPAAMKLQTCRSRNDQVVFDTKLYCREELGTLIRLLEEIRAALKKMGENHPDLILPGMTHLQNALPVRLRDWLDAYRTMISRDIQRCQQTLAHIVPTQGAGSCAGTFIPSSVYRKFIHPTENALDVVSDRDFVVACLADIAVCGMHLSRLCEDWILWASPGYRFIDVDESFCTGSSLMPQKKNPDALELIRGSTGRLYGNLINVLVVLKGLPLSYNRDLQHDKEPLFDSLDTIQHNGALLAALIPHIRFNPERIQPHLEDESLYATDIADFLVQHQVPFQKAHEAVGRLIRQTVDQGRSLLDLPEKTLRAVHPALTREILRRILNPRTSVQAKKSQRKKRT